MLTLICALKLPSTAAVGVTFTIPDPVPMRAVNCSPCVVDSTWFDPVETMPCDPRDAASPEVGAVGLALRLQASAKTDPPMTIDDARDKRDISTSVSR